MSSRTAETRLHSISPPYGVSGEPFAASAAARHVPGSRPDWKGANMQSAGVRGVPSAPPSLLAQTGLHAWAVKAAPPAGRPGQRRHYPDLAMRHAPAMAEPSVEPAPRAGWGGISSYRTRRAVTGQSACSTTTGSDAGSFLADRSATSLVPPPSQRTSAARVTAAAAAAATAAAGEGPSCSSGGAAGPGAALPQEYRPSRRKVPQDPPRDRPQGRRLVELAPGRMGRCPWAPDGPRGSQAPGHGAGPSRLNLQPALPAPPPELPFGSTMGRPGRGQPLCEQEMTLEQLTGRRARPPASQQGACGSPGCSGESPQRHGRPPQPEDDPTYFRTQKDRPDYVRWAAALPQRPPGVATPHERRAAGVQAAAARDLREARRLVAGLSLPGGED